MASLRLENGNWLLVNGDGTLEEHFYSTSKRY